MNFSDIVFVILNGLFEVYLICFFFGAFAPARDFKGRDLLLALFSVLFIASLWIQKNAYLNFAFLMLVIYFISLLYDTKWYNQIFLTLAFSLLGSFAELIVAISSSYIFNVEMAVLKTGAYYISGVLLSKFFTFLIVAVLKIQRHSLPVHILRRFLICILTLPVVSVILVFILADYMYMIVGSPWKQTTTVFTLFLLILTNVLFFYILDRISDDFMKEQQLMVATNLIECQKTAYRDLYESQTEVKKIRHDLKNAMIGILHELENGQTETAADQIRRQCEAMRLQSFQSGYSIIDALITEKKSMAKNAGVKMEVSVELSRQIEINPVDFSILLGNAIDNAIEAAEKCGKEKPVTVSILTRQCNLIIVIRNPVAKKINTEKMKTTKEDKRLHGFGLLQMESLTKKYHGDLVLNCDEHCFQTTMLLRNVG